MAEQLRICAYVDELGKLMHTDTQRLKSDIALTPHAPAQLALDELRREVERLTLERNEAIVERNVEAALRGKACGEVEALRADRDRLDWLESKSRRTVGDFMNPPCVRLAFDHFWPGMTFIGKPTLRAAIDTARAQRESN